MKEKNRRAFFESAIPCRRRCIRHTLVAHAYNRRRGELCVVIGRIDFYFLSLYVYIVVYFASSIYKILQKKGEIEKIVLLRIDWLLDILY